MRSVKDLDKRLAELTQNNRHKREELFATSDNTREKAGSVQTGLYAAQIGISLFRNLTNYHLPLKKRIKKIAVSIFAMVALNFFRKKLGRKK